MLLRGGALCLLVDEGKEKVDRLIVSGMFYHYVLDRVVDCQRDVFLVGLGEHLSNQFVVGLIVSLGPSSCCDLDRCGLLFGMAWRSRELVNQDLMVAKDELKAISDRHLVVGRAVEGDQVAPIVETRVVGHFSNFFDVQDLHNGDGWAQVLPYDRYDGVDKVRGAPQARVTIVGVQVAIVLLIGVSRLPIVQRTFRWESINCGL